MRSRPDAQRKKPMESAAEVSLPRGTQSSSEAFRVDIQDTEANSDRLTVRSSVWTRRREMKSGMIMKAMVALQSIVVVASVENTVIIVIPTAYCIDRSVCPESR